MYIHPNIFFDYLSKRGHGGAMVKAEVGMSCWGRKCLRRNWQVFAGSSHTREGFFFLFVILYVIKLVFQEKFGNSLHFEIK